MDLLRFATAGSVDDGKSTLIGRLLHDTKSLFDDQTQSLQRLSDEKGVEELELALLTDGLRAEREQGITIDVAYRYFATPHRRFIIADTPGHVEYTRNMVTGASTADVALVLIDARKGIIEQSRRHLAISSLLGIPDIVLCINKMDLVDWSEQTFRSIEAHGREIAEQLGRAHLRSVPVSALLGDNVVDASANTPWYDGAPLLEILETIDVEADATPTAPRFPVQYVIRPPQTDYRGYAGRVSGGTFTVGDEVIVLPSGTRSRIASIETFDGPLDSADLGDSVTLLLDNDLDISRGDTIAAADQTPIVTSEITADVCWMTASKDLTPGTRVKIKHGTRVTKAIVTSVDTRLDLDTLQHTDEHAGALRLNEIGKVIITTATPLCFDTYADNRQTGSFILIDEASGDTIAAGMIL
jgi:bifunctional enzyme CysN/CysC